MTQQSHSQAYTLRKPKLKEIHVSRCSLQHYLQQNMKQPRCPSTDEWIKKLWEIYTMEYHSAIKRKTFESVVMRWMNLEPIIQSEVSQRKKDKYHIITYIYVYIYTQIQKNGTQELIYRATMEKQKQRIDLWTREEGRRG